MAKRRKFRKVYFIAEDNQLFRAGYHFVKVFRSEPHAKEVARRCNRDEMAESTKLFNQNKAMTRYHAEGFYLVHESLFDEIIKPFSELDGAGNGGKGPIKLK